MIATKRKTRRTTFGMCVTILLVAGAATAWGYFVPLDGAVVASGTVAVDGNVKKIQHAIGGNIAHIAVVEGQQVKAGDLLVRLSDTATRTNLGVVVNELAALRARLARLRAERDGLNDVNFPDDLARNPDPEIQMVVEGERTLFTARSKARAGQKQQLVERIAQLREEIAGLEDQKRATSGQLDIARVDRDVVAPLEGGVVNRARRSELMKDVFRLEGAVGELRSRIAQSFGKIAETEVQIAQLDRDTATEVAKEIREVETRIGELTEKKTAAEDLLRRIELRAPVNGTVHGLTVSTVDGVVSPGEAMMSIVPNDQSLIIEARVATTDRDLVTVGQRTRVRFPGLNQQTTPEIAGSVFRVAEAATIEQQTGASYYVVGVRLAAAELQRLGTVRLVPGMPAEAFIATGERTLASYLFKPISDQMARALREGR